LLPELPELPPLLPPRLALEPELLLDEEPLF
jgi:hypothetical protein